MKKPGIFDPWRQAAPTPVKEKQLSPLDEEVTVRFDGLRGGFSVKVKESPPDEAAKKAVVKVVHGLKQRGAPLSKYAVHTEPIEHPRCYTLSDGAQVITVTVEHNDNRLSRHAVDSLCALFRDAEATPALASFLGSSKLTPYLK